MDWPPYKLSHRSAGLGYHASLDFVQHLTDPILSQATEDVWAMEVARMNQESGGAKKKIHNTMKFFKDLQHTATNLMSGKSDDEEEDPDYLKVREYMTHLESHLIEAHRQAARLIRKQGELGVAVGEFGQAAEKLGKFEEGSLQEAFMHLGSHAGLCWWLLLHTPLLLHTLLLPHSSAECSMCWGRNHCWFLTFPSPPQWGCFIVESFYLRVCKCATDRCLFSTQ